MGVAADAAPPERTWTISRTDDGAWAGFAGSEQVVRADDASSAFRVVGKDLELWIGGHAEGRAFVHAGVVVVRGEAIVIPGPSRAGKSTLVAALLARGADYWSDEYAVIDSGGLVHPYPRPLSLRADVPRYTLPCPAADRPSADRGASIAVVAALRFGSQLCVDRISPSAGLITLLENSLGARTNPELTLAALERVSSTATCVAGTRAGAPEAADLLLALVDGPR